MMLLLQARPRVCGSRCTLQTSLLLNSIFLFKCRAALDNLAQATVTALPAKTPGPAEELPKAGEVLPPHTSPDPGFGKEVSSGHTVPG